MSNKRYIQIESTYRDRKSWRNPSEFEIPLNQRVQTRHTAYDSVCDSAPIHQWKVNEFNVGATDEKVLKGSVNVNFVDGRTTPASVPGLTSAGDQKTIIIKFVTTDTEHNVPQKIKDYYVGAVMEANVYNVVSSDGLIKKERRRIVSSTYLAPDQYSVVGGVSSDEHYVQFTLDRNFSDDVHHGVYSSTSGVTPGGATPISIIDPSFSTTTNGVEKVFVPYGRLGEDSYRDYYLYNDDNEESYKITNYDPITHLLTIDSIPTNTLMGQNVCIRKSLPLHTDTILASGTKDIEVAASNLNTEEDFYKGHYIRILNGVDSENLKIVKSEFISTGPHIKFTFDKIITSSITPTTYEILSFSRDNLSSLNYTGSTVSNQESKCHEIELLNMILPNKIVKNGNGSRLTYYPYLYVEFTNITSPTSNGSNIIYSNNPNSKKCIFKATMDDIPNPLTSPFIKIDGDGMLQTIKFKVNDNLKFVVRLPNGEPLEFDEQDTITPVEPDPYGQISALFSVRQL